MARLKATFPEKCIGCDLCVMEVQRQLGKVGLDGALIRVFRERLATDESEKLAFSIDIDPQVNELDIKEIKNICPTAVFTIEEEEEPVLA